MMRGRYAGQRMPMPEVRPEERIGQAGDDEEPLQPSETETQAAGERILANTGHQVKVDKTPIRSPYRVSKHGVAQAIESLSRNEEPTVAPDAGSKDAPPPKMPAPQVFSQPIQVIGNGRLRPEDYHAAREHTSHIVALDGGADRLRAIDPAATPAMIVGDFDSITPETQAHYAARGVPMRNLAHDQDSTDLQKALAHTQAPLYVATGFEGNLDHQLAALSAMRKEHASKPVVLNTGEDVSTVLPANYTSHFAPGTRMSLFPLAPTSVSYQGMAWPAENLPMEIGGTIGTSNAAAAPEQRIISTPGGALLLSVPKGNLRETIASLLPPEKTNTKAEKQSRL